MFSVFFQWLVTVGLESSLTPACYPHKTYSKFKDIVTCKCLANHVHCHLILFVFLGTRIECQVHNLKMVWDSDCYSMNMLSMNKNPTTLNTAPLFLAKGHENAFSLLLLRSDSRGERRRYLRLGRNEGCFVLVIRDLIWEPGLVYRVGLWDKCS